MERITSPGRILLILIKESLASRYLQLFKPALIHHQEKELMRYPVQQHTLRAFPANTNILINNTFTLNGLLIENQDENVFYANNYWFRTTKRVFDILF